MLFSLFLLLFLLLLDEAEQIYLIPHTPLYPIYQLSLETNRQPVLFMTIDTFFFLLVFLCEPFTLHHSQSSLGSAMLVDSGAWSSGGRGTWVADVAG